MGNQKEEQLEPSPVGASDTINLEKKLVSNLHEISHVFVRSVVILEDFPVKFWWWSTLWIMLQFGMCHLKCLWCSQLLGIIKIEACIGKKYLESNLTLSQVEFSDKSCEKLLYRLPYPTTTTLNPAYFLNKLLWQRLWLENCSFYFPKILRKTFLVNYFL